MLACVVCIVPVGKGLSVLQVSPDCKVIILPKEEVDKANKDKKHLPPNFQVHTCTDPIELVDRSICERYHSVPHLIMCRALPLISNQGSYSE